MNNFQEKVNFIFSIADTLRGPYKPNQYGKVILPLTVLRRLDCVLDKSKDKVLGEYDKHKDRPPEVLEKLLNRAAGQQFHNISKLDFQMISTAEEHLKKLNPDAKPEIFGQDYNDESYAVCGSDMLIKGHSIKNIVFGDVLNECIWQP